MLTRLPGSSRLTAAHAARLISRELPGSVALPPSIAVGAVPLLAEAGIAGGAVYDGLVGLAAKTAGITLLSCDRRAMSTYAAFGVDVRLI
ncbi:hypothetical protein [Microbacterium sp.]|uniref:hypothetical protein n=1 Tax=Microbacterium sp. TaxID=51671 RepID=UPI001AD08970|nr:hypothetical protein [Microbacterium sp.]MBN9156620.1 hypothetical protein [Microbacterium sp.]MBS1899935.1 hypothetical protein [Actinomycetota bacterium]